MRKPWKSAENATVIDLRLDAYVNDRTEHPPLFAAARRLGELLEAASGVRHEVRVNFRDNYTTSESIEGTAFSTVVSLLGDIGADRVACADIEARWRHRVDTLMAASAHPVFLCTILRHVARRPEATGEPTRERILKRIRRLNLMIAELSQATGVGVIDIDRTLAHIGARALQTDYRLTGSMGAETAGRVIVSALLDTGLDDLVDLDRLNEARRLDAVFETPAHARDHGGVLGFLHRLRRCVTPGAPNAG